MPLYEGLQLSGYLQGLRVPARTTEMIKQFIHEYKVVMGFDPEFIFVENPVDALGSPEFTNLLMLSNHTYMEFSLNQPNKTVIFLNMARSINRLFMPVMQQIAFDEVTEQSRLSVQIFDDIQIIGYFVASGANCNDLLDVVRRYFIPAINE